MPFLSSFWQTLLKFNSLENERSSELCWELTWGARMSLRTCKSTFGFLHWEKVLNTFACSSPGLTAVMPAPSLVPPIPGAAP